MPALSVPSFELDRSNKAATRAHDVCVRPCPSHETLCDASSKRPSARCLTARYVRMFSGTYSMQQSEFLSLPVASRRLFRFSNRCSRVQMNDATRRHPCRGDRCRRPQPDRHQLHHAFGMENVTGSCSVQAVQFRSKIWCGPRRRSRRLQGSDHEGRVGRKACRCRGVGEPTGKEHKVQASYKAEKALYRWDGFPEAITEGKYYWVPGHERGLMIRDARWSRGLPFINSHSTVPITSALVSSSSVL